MPKWWPFGRAKQINADDSAAPVAAAIAPVQPAWRSLPAIQRTVGDIESTTRLGGFNEALTTSQDPTLIGSVEVLTADGSNRLSILDVTPASEPGPSGTGVGPPRGEATARSFAPPPLKVQRASLDSEVSGPAQGDGLESRVYRAVLPVHGEVRLLSMVEARSPDERRPLPVVDVLQAGSAVPLQSAPVPPSPRSRTPLQRSLDPDSAPQAHEPDSPARPTVASSATSQPEAPNQSRQEPPPLGATEPRRPDADDSTPSASDQVTYDPVVAAPMTVARGEPASLAPPLRILSTVQRAHSSPSVPLGTAAPIPVLRVVNSAAFATPETGRVTPPTSPPAPAATMRAVAAPRSTMPDDPGVTTASPSERTSVSPPTIQRLADATPGHHPPRTSLPDAAPHSLHVANPPRERTTAPPIDIQRSSDGPMVTTAGPRNPMWLPVGDVPTSSPTVPDIGDSAPGRPPSRLDSFAVESQSPPPDPDSDAVAHQDSGPRSDRAVSIQRVELPIVSHHTTGDAHTGDTAPAARAVPSARLVVLPPLRGTDSTPTASRSPQAVPARSVVAESTRPIGLQRMFGGAVRPSDVAPRRSVDPAEGPRSFEVADHATAWRTGSAAESFGGDAGGGHYDAATNTISFAEPTIQRAADGQAPSEAPSVPVSPPTSMTVAPSTTPPATDVDELVNRLYDPLAARLRAELWQDRERAGVLMDLGR